LYLNHFPTLHHRDYAPAPELDFYDTSVLADEAEGRPVSYEQMIRDRRAAEEELDAMDARRRELEEEAEDNLDAMNERDRDELEEYEDDDDDEEEDEYGVAAEERALNLEAFECPLAEWIAEERTRREIQRRFKTFLLTFFPGIDDYSRWKSRQERDETVVLPPNVRQLPPVYPPKIRAMCAANRSSLEVSYVHLGEMQSLLAIWLTDLPRDMLQIFDEVLHQVVLAEFPHYAHVSEASPYSLQYQPQSILSTERNYPFYCTFLPPMCFDRSPKKFTYALLACHFRIACATCARAT
jgi:DNA replication licensing factor MCM2